MSIPHIPLNKKNISLISTSAVIVFSLGLIFENQNAISQNNKELLIHQTDETPHIGTEKTLDFFDQTLTIHIQTDLDQRAQLDDKTNDINDKLDNLLIIICSNPNNKCR